MKMEQITYKQKIYAHCLQLLNNKVADLEKILKDLDESAASDPKNTAGDKHETSRAMIHIEQETIAKKLHETLEQKALFEKINCNIPSSQIIKGSLVKANGSYLFLSIAFGKIELDGSKVMVISPQSPLGMKLIGLKAGHSVQSNGMNYSIEAIY